MLANNTTNATVISVLNRTMDDPWCSRLAAMHLLHLVATGEDMEKDLVTFTAADLKRYATELARAEQLELQSR